MHRSACRVILLLLAPITWHVDAHVARAQTEFTKTTVTYRQVAGHDVLADVYRTDDNEIRPVIVWIHGGALIYLHCRQQGTWPKEVTGFDPVTEAEQISPYEPVRNVTKDFSPTFLIHGTDDTDVPFEQSMMMVEQFRRHEVPHTLEAIDNGEHGLGGGDPQDIKDAYAAMKAFIVRHMESR
jgi:dipeptidyl aminopeptidase/acylaminoacyl peptidase